MNITVTYQESYSRKDLLLRTFFGPFYIILPHIFLMYFALIWSSIISFLSFWIVLFTGKYPRSFWDFNMGLQKWSLRLNAVIYNLVDGYPDFWVDKNNNDQLSNIELEYPEEVSRGSLLIRTFFGFFYILLPHLFMLLFRSFATNVLVFLAWWVVLFTGRYPQTWHEFNVGTLRWSIRVNLYISFLSHEYPPFSGK